MSLLVALHEAFFLKVGLRIFLLYFRMLWREILWMRTGGQAQMKLLTACDTILEREISADRLRSGPGDFQHVFEGWRQSARSQFDCEQ